MIRGLMRDEMERERARFIWLVTLAKILMAVE